jgi:gluconokinase
MTKPPRSPNDETSGLRYFARMLDKIRLFASGELRPDFHANLGKGADKWCCGFLRVEYEKLKARVLAGGTDEENLEWCYTNGRRLDATDLLVWNGFSAKVGWRDFASDRLMQVKAESGLADRDDIQTMTDYMEVDEGRRP